MRSRAPGDEARLVATALQAFEEAGAEFGPVLDLVCQLGCDLTGDPWIIRLVEDDAVLRLAGCAAPDPRTTADIRATMASLTTRYSRKAFLPVWGPGVPVLLTPELLAANRDNAEPEVLALADRNGFEGGLMAPMRVRGRVIGALWWACQEHGGDHDAGDLAFAASVADRCALAIDNARLLRSIAAERNRHAALLGHVSDAVCVVDATGVVTHVTPGGVTRVLGFQPDELLGVNIFDLVHRKDQLGAMDGFINAMGPDDRPPLQLRARHKEGGWRHLLVTANNLLDDPAVEGVVITAQDVTEQVLADALLTAENDILERVAVGGALGDTLDEICRMVDAHVRYGVCTLWLVEEESGELNAEAGPNAGPLPTLAVEHRRAGVGFVRSLPIDGISMSEPDTGPEWGPWREAAKAAGIGCSWTRAIRDASDSVYGAVIVYRRDTREPNDHERKTIELAARLAGVAVHRARDAERLAHAASHDTVTGLPNRRLFMERLQHAVARQRRGARPPAVLFLDLDRFKQVNDRAGHAAGDDVLRLVGIRLQDAVRPTDLVARFGGDEFAVLCDETDETEALVVAERLLAAICAPVELGSRRHHLSASIGVAGGRGGVGHDVLVRRADIAMYRAKAQGAGGIVAFRTGMSDRGRGDLEHDLRRAIEHGEISVHYQPVVDLRRGEWVGVEALARWWHEKQGWVPPSTFIAMAEETGLIVPLGEHVLRVATHRGAAWAAAGLDGVEMAINVSGRQLAEPRFASMIERVLDESGFDPHLLQVELTETTMMEDFDMARAAIAQLESLGVALVIDDFGTGHSTLARLRHFPARALKLDRTFVIELGEDPASEGVIAAVVQLAHAVDLAVVGEGVETAEQLTILRRLGVDCAQGYLLAAPAPPDEAARVLTSAPVALLRAGLSSALEADPFAVERTDPARR